MFWLVSNMLMHEVSRRMSSWNGGRPLLGSHCTSGGLHDLCEYSDGLYGLLCILGDLYVFIECSGG